MRSEAEIREAIELIFHAWRQSREKAGKDCYAQCRGVLNWMVSQESAFGDLLEHIRAEIARERAAERAQRQ